MRPLVAHSSGVPGRPPFIAKDIDRDTVAEIRRLLADRGMTQKQLAKAAGIHPMSLNRYLTLKRRISIQDLDRIEEILGPCRGPRVALPAEQASREVSMKPDERRLLRMYREMDVKRRRELLGTAVEMLGDEEEQRAASSAEAEASTETSTRSPSGKPSA